MIILLLYGPQIAMYYLYAYDTVESGIKQLNWNWIDSPTYLPKWVCRSHWSFCVCFPSFPFHGVHCCTGCIFCRWRCCKPYVYVCICIYSTTELSSDTVSHQRSWWIHQLVESIWIVSFWILTVGGRIILQSRPNHLLDFSRGFVRSPRNSRNTGMFNISDL